MALIKKTEQPSGVSGEYWKVGAVRMHNESATVDMDLYVDESNRRAGKSTVQSKLYSFEGFSVKELDAADMNPIKLAYAKAKEHDDFKDAEDA